MRGGVWVPEHKSMMSFPVGQGLSMKPVKPFYTEGGVEIEEVYM